MNADGSQKSEPHFCSPIFAQQLDHRRSVVHVQCERYFEPPLFLALRTLEIAALIATFTRDAAVSS
jgi:hypothetical protein